MANSLKRSCSHLAIIPSFRYEKFRAEWSDGKGHVVLDETPIGFFGEIEGPARWIDQTARHLGIDPTSPTSRTAMPNCSLPGRQRTGSPAKEMTFRAMRAAKRAGLTSQPFTSCTASSHDFASSPASKDDRPPLTQETGLRWIGTASVWCGSDRHGLAEPLFAAPPPTFGQVHIPAREQSSPAGRIFCK